MKGSDVRDVSRFRLTLWVADQWRNDSRAPTVSEQCAKTTHCPSNFGPQDQCNPFFSPTGRLACCHWLLAAVGLANFGLGTLLTCDRPDKSLVVHQRVAVEYSYNANSIFVPVTIGSLPLLVFVQTIGRMKFNIKRSISHRLQVTTMRPIGSL